MSEVIVRMKMPKTCEDCDAQYDCMACGITGTRWYGNAEFDPSKGRLSDCPIIAELPEQHGDLIDKRELLKKGMDMSWSIQKWVQEVDIVIAPAIVPATERSETWKSTT